MIRLRRGTVVAVKESRPDLQDLVVEVGGRAERALAYPLLSGPVEEGDPVLLNTAAMSLGLGTGGFHLVLAVEGREGPELPDGAHVMKLRYTPLQAAVSTVEQQGSPSHERMRDAKSLDGLPVVWAPLHSMVLPVAAGARAAGAERAVFVMTDGAALPAWMSNQLRAGREAGLVSSVVTCGQALGGDLEAVNIFSGLLAAREEADADVVIVGDGPGKVGTGTPWGASEVASGMALNAVGILGGRPVCALRINTSDPGYRHYGVSPHSLKVLREVALVPVHVAVPTLDGASRDLVWDALRAAELEERHQLVEVEISAAEGALAGLDVPLSTMGRTRDEEPLFFAAAAAAGILAGRMAAGTKRWQESRTR